MDGNFREMDIPVFSGQTSIVVPEMRLTALPFRYRSMGWRASLRLFHVLICQYNSLLDYLSEATDC